MDWHFSYFFFEGLWIGCWLGLILIWWRLWRSPQILYRLWWFVGTLVFGITIIWTHWVTPYQLVVREVDWQLSGLPTLRVVLVSDLHVGYHKNASWTRQVVHAINNLKDIEGVLWAGDFMFGDARFFAADLYPLCDIQTPVHLAVLGNHDHNTNKIKDARQSQAVSAVLQECDIRELKNEAWYWKEKNLWVLGIDDNDLGYDDLYQAWSESEPEATKVLLAHSPDIVDKMFSQYKIDLVLAGHTHCGQIRLPWLGAVPGIIPTENGKKLEKHAYQHKNINVFVTCGLGESGTRARFLNPPEIIVLNINR